VKDENVFIFRIKTKGVEHILRQLASSGYYKISRPEIGPILAEYKQVFRQGAPR